MSGEMIDYLRKNRPMRKQRPTGYGITAREYAQAEGVSTATANRVLSEMEGLGIVKFEEMICSGKVTRVYTKAGK